MKSLYMAVRWHSTNCVLWSTHSTSLGRWTCCLVILEFWYTVHNLGGGGGESCTVYYENQSSKSHNNCLAKWTLGALGTRGRAFTDGSQLLRGDCSHGEQPSQEPLHGRERNWHLPHWWNSGKRGRWDSGMKTTPEKSPHAQENFCLNTNVLQHNLIQKHMESWNMHISKCHWLQRLDLCSLLQQ